MMDLGLVNTKEAAEILRVSPSALHKMRNEGELPFVKLGRKVFFKKSSLAEYVDSKQQVNVTGETK